MMEIRKHKVNNLVLFNQIAEKVASGCSVRFKVKGNSMNPILVHDRDEVIVSPFNDEELVRGVLVLGKDSKERVLLHRVLKREGDMLTLMGDGNWNLKETVPVHDVAGIVKAVVRKGKVWDAASFSMHIYVAVWLAMLPVRRYLLAFLRKINRKMFKKV